MPKNIQAIRGMHDILPEQTASWQFLEQQVRALVQAYGYREMRMPILEKTELFKRSIGEVTDIVEKEMYTFDDRNGDSLTLRPEGTAGAVRAGIEHGLLYNQTQRVWYMGPMFRHERPQKGRYRQFHQIGVEAFGFPGPDIEAELLFMGARMWQQLGLKDIVLEINTLGSHVERVAYREHLVAYLCNHEDRLDEDSRRRLHSNPLRILDSKNPEMQSLIEAAPRLFDHLGVESREHYEYIKALLDAAGISYRENPRLVRGLDYYCHTVFEWVTERLGAQGTVCAGGRYDALVEQLGGKPTPAAGFALGVERLIALLEEEQVEIPHHAPHLFMAMMGDEAQHHGLVLAEQLRTAHPWLRLQANCGGGGFKAQFKRADRSGAELALIIGDDELRQHTVSIKNLRGEGEQFSLPQVELGQFLNDLYDKVKGVHTKD